MKSNQLEDYLQFISVITNLLNEHFDAQNEYIHCKEGCAHCCRDAEYPCSELEFEFLKIGFANLEKEIQQKIVERIIKLKEKKTQFKGDKFTYECPFLINNKCSVYDYRMIICRTFGLSYYDYNEQSGKNELKIPFCVLQGLNYSEVYDKETKGFSTELFNESGYKNEPMAYNLGVESLMNKFGKDVMGLEFGKLKTLIDWL